MAAPTRLHKRQKSSPEFWIEAGVDQDGFEKKFISKLKGYGVFCKRNHDKGDFLLEYTGELLENKNVISKRQLQHEISSKRLAKRGHVPRFYMFYFKYNGKKVCIDATHSKGRLGQYVNDAKEGGASCNARMKLFPFKNKPRLILIASRNIETGEEISFDYGDYNNLWWRKKEAQDVLPPLEKMMSPAVSESSEHTANQPRPSLEVKIQASDKESDSIPTKHSDSEISTVNQLTTCFDIEIPPLARDSDGNPSKYCNSPLSTVNQQTTSLDVEVFPFNIGSDCNSTEHCNSQLSAVNQASTSLDIDRTSNLALCSNCQLSKVDQQTTSLDIDTGILQSDSTKHCNSNLSTVNKLTASFDVEIPSAAIENDSNLTKHSDSQVPIVNEPKTSIVEEIPPSDDESDSNSITYPYLDTKPAAVSEADSACMSDSEGHKVQTVSDIRQGLHDYSKQHACFFCGKLDFKITRHLCTWHKGENQIRSLPPPTKDKQSDVFKERERALDMLRNQGDFIYNVNQLQSGKGPLIIARRPEDGKHSAMDYLPCQYCLKFMIKKELWRHSKNCKFAPITKGIHEASEVKASRALLYGAGVFNQGESTEFYQNVMETMKNDDIGKSVKNDYSIMKVGQVMYGRLGRNRAAEVRYRIRLLGRLKCRLVPDSLHRRQNQLVTYIKPERFNDIIDAVKQVVRVSDETSLNGVIMFDKPETAKKMGQLVKRLAEFKQGQAIKERNSGDRQDAIDFLTLYSTEWKDVIGSIACQTTKERRYNKKDMLPLTEDLVKLRRYCDKMIIKQSNLLQDSTNIQNWRKLANITLCKVQLFNFRRGNECSKMLIEKYQTRADWRQCNEEIFNSLDKVECQLAKRMDLVEIMGKKNRKVPVLLTPSIRDALDLLNSTRKDVKIPESNPYVFAKGSENYIRGSDALNTVLDMVPGLQNPEFIRFPKMRKYLATVVQIYGLSEIELQEVARHLGHELSVHRQYYRLQDDVIELAKISKLLLAVESGKAHKFAGKSLEDIDIDGLPDIEENPEPEQEAEEEMEIDQNQEHDAIVNNLVQVEEPQHVRRLRQQSNVNVQYQYDEEEDLDDTVKDPSYTKEISDTASDSDEDLCHIAQKRKKIDPKRKWSDIEKVSMQPLVVTAVREGKPPKKEDIQQLQKKSSVLKKMQWIKIKHHVWATAQTQLKKLKRK